MSKRGSIYWQLNDRDWLYKKYWDEELSPQKIAKILGCSRTIVRDALKRRNIRIRSLSETQKGEKNPLFGKTHSEETRKKMSDAWEGRIVSKDARKNMSAALKGNKNTLGYKHTEATKKKMSIAHIKLTPAQRKINNAMKTNINRALRGAKNGRHWIDFVGYTLLDLMQIIEKEFRDGMSWDNYGKFWHLDHIIPLARFHYEVPEDPEFKKAWSLGNLQPLLVSENLRKNDKFMFY